MQGPIQSHCIVLQSLAKILRTLMSDFIGREIELHELLREMEKINLPEMKKWMRSHYIVV